MRMSIRSWGEKNSTFLAQPAPNTEKNSILARMWKSKFEIQIKSKFAGVSNNSILLPRSLVTQRNKNHVPGAASCPGHCRPTVDESSKGGARPLLSHYRRRRRARRGKKSTMSSSSFAPIHLFFPCSPPPPPPPPLLCVVFPPWRLNSHYPSLSLALLNETLSFFSLLSPSSISSPSTAGWLIACPSAKNFCEIRLRSCDSSDRKRWKKSHAVIGVRYGINEIDPTDFILVPSIHSIFRL